MRLQDKVAVITGGGSGIGLAAVKEFLKQGTKVAIWDLNSDQVQDLLKSEGESQLRFYSVNTAESASVNEAAEKVIQDLQEIEGWNNGHIIINSGCIIRNLVDGRVVAIHKN